MAESDARQQGIEAFIQRSWGDAFSCLTLADKEYKLDAEELELLAKSAYLLGKESECIEIWSRAHHRLLKAGNTKRASNSAFWIGLLLMNQGGHAQGSGWMARAQRLIDEYNEDCAEAGLLIIPQGLQHLRTGHADKALKLFSDAALKGKKFNDPDLVVLGWLGSGQALIQQFEIKKGTRLFDEAMVAVVSNEISPIVAGIVYCAVIEACQKIYDLQRAQEWTEALSRWCNSQPDLIPYRGQCMVRRAEIMQLHGEWPNAMKEIRRVCELSQISSPPATGEAFYTQAELYRLQGKYLKAEEAYKESNKWGRNPQPGLALLHLALGKTETAKNSIVQAEHETQERLGRSRILPAYVDIMIASCDLQYAESKCLELSKIASDLGAPFLKAIADRAEGSIHLASERAGDALKFFRRSWSTLNSINCAYEAARTQVQIGLASRILGDINTAEMEFETAKIIFQQLGASSDLKEIHALEQKKSSDKIHGLTKRELEILSILATGMTNKSIANKLFISERTVDRHVSNILNKLNISSRVAATAYAYEHDLV